MRRIYFDYAASTPMDQRVFAEMQPYFCRKFGNPGSLHSFGQEAIAVMDRSREIIAKAIGASFREIIFTGSATEANNLALRGSILGLTRRVRGSTEVNIRNNQREISENLRPRLIVSAIEHESVLETARDLEYEGIEVIYVPVTREGVIDLKKLKSAITQGTVLVSVMYANNEVGTIQPIAEISKLISEFRKQKIENRSNKNSAFRFLHSTLSPLFHTDAAQAFQFLDCDVNKLGVDLMTLSAHKIYGPKGIGALYIRNSKREILNSKQFPNSKSKIKNVSDLGFRTSDLSQLVKPIVTGGGQEFGLRSGTENIPSIAGFAKAAELTEKNRISESKRIGSLRNYFWENLKKIYPKAEINGVIPPTNNWVAKNKRIPKLEAASLFPDRLPNILNVYFPRLPAQELVAKFDLAGIAVSAGSACKARAIEPSYVIEALGYSKERAGNSIRFSFGRPTTKKEIDKALKIIRKLLK